MKKSYTAIKVILKCTYLSFVGPMGQLVFGAGRWSDYSTRKHFFSSLTHSVTISFK